jgi:DNA primase
MRIPEQTVKEIELATDIVDVVQDYVSLKKRGQNYWACCPFHDERSPSFSVTAQKGIFKCFGCGKAGDAVKFVMEINKISYVEALVRLAEKYHIEIAKQEESPAEIALNLQKESLFVAMSFAKKFYQDQLWQTDEGLSLGLGYFKERGLNEDTVRSFGLGYSPDSWDSFFREAEKNGFRLEVLKSAGLVSENEQGRVYDRFRGRVMFPIHDTSGRVVAFGARTLKRDDKPKYLNSPETPIYDKSQTLYGLFEAKSHIRKSENVYLTEGYLDVLASVQAGVPNTVASAGTSLTPNQIKSMRKLAPRATILYDGDSAGIKAALRGIDLILEGGMDTKVVLFPEGEDPDSFIQKNGHAAYRTFIAENEQDFILFKSNLLDQEAQNDPLKRAQLLQQTAESIAKIPDTLKREAYTKATSKQLQIREEDLYQAVNSALLEHHKHKLKDQIKEIQSQESPASILYSPLMASEREFIRVLMLYGGTPLGEHGRLCDYMLEESKGLTISDESLAKIVDGYRSLHPDEPFPSPKSVIQGASPEIREVLANLLVDAPTPSSNWMEKHEIYAPNYDEELDKVLYNNILHLKFRYLEKLCYELSDHINQEETATDVPLLENLIQKYQLLSRQRVELASMIGLVIGRSSHLG